VNRGLLPEGIAASPMLMSNIGWTRSSLALADGDVEGPFQTNQRKTSEVPLFWEQPALAI
jgi:hypothetical protein